jgi:hypothetical protein
MFQPNRAIVFFALQTVFWLSAMSLARLAFGLWFAPAGDPLTVSDWASALFLGFRFDARSLASVFILVFPLLLVPGLSPWSSWRWLRRTWQVLFIAFGLLVSFIYVLDAGHYSYLQNRLDASVLSFQNEARDSLRMVWLSYPVVWILLAMAVFVSFYLWLCQWFYQIAQKFRMPYVSLQAAAIQLAYGLIFFLLLAFAIHGRFSWNFSATIYGKLSTSFMSLRKKYYVLILNSSRGACNNRNA